MNVNPLCKLQIVVLAAGFSSRLGRPKALARVHGASLLRRTLDAALSLKAARVVVVIPPNAWQYRSGAHRLSVAWAFNRRRAEGLSSSVRRGVAVARYSSAILLMPVDLANLKRRELARLVRRWQSAPRRLIARRLGASGAAPLILPHWLYPRALNITGDTGLRDLIAQLRTDQRVFVDLPSAVLDVDSPQDLAAVRRRFQPLD